MSEENKNEWIRVEDGLPEEKKIVWLSVRFMGDVVVVLAYRVARGWFGAARSTLIEDPYSKAIAWREIEKPAPFEGKYDRR